MNREKELKDVEEIHQAGLKIDLDKKMEEHSLQKNK